ncbi:hypothetical protein SAMN04487894_11691 [Niabella drilacis]|uniref:DUF4386 domain-containing protein n=2 Tax=Niabella drilacis (strain DSM 25811 / CCM 8410 / CCUG 62505 / LMG 26954 / E90) TaxID=1285928 RepID=A0A1G6YVL7_NIADE|nr:hypothetical protein SAMN04487894_11691 [Niabella drilacis]
MSFSVITIRKAVVYFCRMKKVFTYKRVLGTVTITAGVLSAACMLAGIIAVEFNFDVFSDTTLLLQYARNSKSAYWFLLFDMAGYYLLLLPVIFYLHQQYKYHSPWVPLFTFSGISYVLTGAIGAAALAAVWPYLMQKYSGAPAADQYVIELIFNSMTTAVAKGLWNMLEVLFAAVWWMGFGVLLRRDNKIIGMISIITGAACLSDAVGTITDWNVLAETGVNIYLVLGIVWPVVLGIYILRKSDTIAPFSAVASDFIND